MPMLGVKDVDNYIKRQQRILITNAMRTNCQANRRVTMTSQSKAKKSTASRAGSKSRAAKTPAAKPATPARADDIIATSRSVVRCLRHGRSGRRAGYCRLGSLL